MLSQTTSKVKHMSYDDSLIVKVVWCYYMEDMTQQAIADRFGITRMRVIKLLEKARSEKIVRFMLREDSYHQIGSYQQLTERYGLQDVIMVPSISDNINETVARGAAMYLGEHLKDGDFINVGYGDTTARTLNNLYVPEGIKVSLVSLTGGVKLYALASQNGVQESSRYIVPAPLITSNAEVAAAMMKEPSVKNVLDLTSLARYTIVGIGGILETATVIKEGNMSTADLLRLKADSAVGDILGYFVNQEGQVIDCDFYDRLISTTPEKLKGFSNVIAVAGGVEKAQAIDAVLRTGCIDVLVTDEETGAAVLRVAEE